jgi:hypothetical protein
MYGGQRTNLYVAYIGVANKLKNRIQQHLIRRDSSVATGTSAVGINPDYITEVHWWQHPYFAKRDKLIAAELVAFDVFEPFLRSRGSIKKEAIDIYNDSTFQDEMRELFTGKPTGRLILFALQDALRKIEELEQKVDALERMVGKLEKL